MTRYRTDHDLRRFGTVAVGGSPLRLFRLTEAGGRTVDRIISGDDVPDSRLTRALVDADAIHPDVRGSTSSFTADDVTVVVPTLGGPGVVPDGAVVVDDGSEPPVPGATIRLPTNRGPAAARNAGLATVSTPLVAFVDSDIGLTDGWLDGLLPHFDDEQVALVAPRVRSRRTGSGVRDRYERRHGPLDLGGRPARVRVGSRVAYVPSAAIVCRTDAVRAVGGFDESLRVGEDVDLVWRLDEHGFVVRYDPSVVVEHEPRSTWGAWFRQRTGYGTSAAPLHLRHPGAVAPARIGRWSGLFWAMVVAGRPGAAVITAVASAGPLIRKLRPVPPIVTVRLVLDGHLAAGRQLASATRRAWWPVIGLLALRSRRARAVLVASLLAAPDPLRIADDVAYSVGVWRGMVAQRSVGPLLPLPSRR